MDFDLSEEQRAIAETTRRFVEKEMPRQQVLQWVRDKVEPPQDLFKKLGKMGYYGFLLPEAYSGLEKPDPMGMLAFVEQFARASSAITLGSTRSFCAWVPNLATSGARITAARPQAVVIADEARANCSTKASMPIGSGFSSPL